MTATPRPSTAPTPKAATYKDFRRLLDKEGKNIDAVMIATPDHLHAPIALLLYAAHGKHVWLRENPDPQLLGIATAGRGRREI